MLSLSLFLYFCTSLCLTLCLSLSIDLWSPLFLSLSRRLCTLSVFCSPSQSVCICLRFYLLNCIAFTLSVCTVYLVLLSAQFSLFMLVSLLYGLSKSVHVSLYLSLSKALSLLSLNLCTYLFYLTLSLRLSVYHCTYLCFTLLLPVSLDSLVLCLSLSVCLSAGQQP